MNIRAQISTGLALVVAVFAATSWTNYRAVEAQKPLLAEINQRAAVASQHSIRLYGAVKDMGTQIVQVQQFLSDISATRGQDGLDDGFDRAQEAADNFAAAAALAHDQAQALRLADIDQAIGKAEQAFTPYFATGRKMAETYIAEGAPAGNKLMPAFDQTADLMHQRLDQVAELVGQETTNSMTSLTLAGGRVADGNQQVLRTLSLAALIGLSLAIAVGVLLSAQLSRLFRRLGQDVRTVLDECHDQALLLSAERKDEFGPIARALAQFRANALHIVALQAEQARQSQQAELNRCQALLDMANTVEVETAHAVENVVRETMQMRELAAEMAGSAQHVGENSQGVAAAADQALQNAQAVAGAAEQLSASIREIGGQAALSTQVVAGVVKTAKESVETVHQLSDAMNRIGDVAKLINAIAEQTNLLSLNATIEAARAGEAGKGFAVVAHEVKGLATQTARSTEEITREVDALQNIGRKVTSAISGITATIEEISVIANSIAAAVEEQDAATGEIVRNVVQTTQAAEDVASRIIRVAAEAQTTGQSADLVRAQLETIALRVRELKASLNEVVRTAAPEVDRRRNPRVTLGEIVEIQIGDARMTARMDDLSLCGGHMTEVPDLPDGATVGNLCLPGLPGALGFTVVERQDQSVRIAFDDSAAEAAELAAFIAAHHRRQRQAA